MSKFDDIKELLSNAFPNLADVLEIEFRPKFSVIDYGGQSFIIVNIQLHDEFTIRLDGVETVKSGFDSNQLFNISNSKMVGFIPIDGKKGLLGFGNSHCDFVFFDETDFCFVEFKLNATSKEERAITKNVEKATDQLKNTISLFNYKLAKNYAGLNLEAYVCTPKSYPRFSSSWGGFMNEFLEDYNTDLFQVNDKICEWITLFYHSEKEIYHHIYKLKKAIKLNLTHL